MKSKTNTHGPGCVFMNTGRHAKAFPAPAHGLVTRSGSENENLPTYVAMPDIRGEPPNGKANWSNGFLPAQYQAVVMAAQQPIRNPAAPDGVSAGEEPRLASFAIARTNRHAAQTSRANRVAGAHRSLRAGRPDAALGAEGDATLTAESADDPLGSTAPTIRIRSRRPTLEIACSPAGCWSKASGTSISIAHRERPAWMGC